MDLQHHELLHLRQHFDSCLAQLELRLRDEIHLSEQRILENITKRQDEQFRWLFGMLVVIFLSNSAMIVTFLYLLQKH